MKQGVHTTKVMTTTACTTRMLRRNFEHCAQRKDPTGFWGRKPSGNRSQKPNLLLTGFHQNSEFSWKSWFFVTTWPTLGPFKLSPMNFLEVLPFRIWISMISTGAGREETQIWRLNPEQSWFPRNFQPHSSLPWFSQICPANYNHNFIDFRSFFTGEVTPDSPEDWNCKKGWNYKR